MHTPLFVRDREKIISTQLINLLPSPLLLPTSHHHKTGISVAVTAPAVFRYTGEACPDRHFKAAEIFGADLSKIRKGESAGPLLADQLTKFLENLGVPDGIGALGYTKADIPALVKGTLPQHRVTKLAPLATGAEALEKIFEDAIKNY